MAMFYAAGEPLTCQQIRELDILAIEHVGIPGIVLMENASRAVAEFIYHTLIDPTRSHVVLLCGPGNNGGDGFGAARHLRNAGAQVTVVLAASRENSKGDAAINLGIYERMEGALIDASEPDGLARVRALIKTADVVVDGLLGTGTQGAPRGVIADLVRLANAAPHARRVAIDIPTGLGGDSGQVHEPCFKADATVTFVAPKAGFGAARARDVVGRVMVADIGVPRELIPGRKEISSSA